MEYMDDIMKSIHEIEKLYEDLKVSEENMWRIVPNQEWDSHFAPENLVMNSEGFLDYLVYRFFYLNSFISFELTESKLVVRDNRLLTRILPPPSGFDLGELVMRTLIIIEEDIFRAKGERIKKAIPLNLCGKKLYITVNVTVGFSLEFQIEDLSEYQF